MELIATCFTVLICFASQADGKTRVWIRRLPKLLFFQLQRVTFDPETKVLLEKQIHRALSSCVYIETDAV